MSELSVEAKRRLLRTATAVLGAVTLTACSGDLRAGSQDTVTVTVTKAPTPTGIDGPCEPVEVFAQKRWPPQGAAERDYPDLYAKQVGGYPGNAPVMVDGWTDTADAYPNNRAPFKGGEWLHTTKHGWVNSAAVREVPDYQYDPTGLSVYGGEPVILDPDCEIPLSKIAKP
jgi:hypothetical protein